MRDGPRTHFVLIQRLHHDLKVIYGLLYCMVFCIWLPLRLEGVEGQSEKDWEKEKPVVVGRKGMSKGQATYCCFLCAKLSMNIWSNENVRSMSSLPAVESRPKPKSLTHLLIRQKCEKKEKIWKKQR